MSSATTPAPTALDCPGLPPSAKAKCAYYDPKVDTTYTRANDMIAFTRKRGDYNFVGAEMMLPKRCVNRQYGYYWWIDNHSNSNSFAIGTIVILIVFMFINWKTWHPYRVDFYKIINYYMLGTLSFGIALTGFGGLGFTRPIAVGVLLHNSAEFFILKRLWFGKYGVGIWVYVTGAVYQLAMVISITAMPLNYLYLLAMWQGASMDFALVQSFLLVALHYQDFRGKYWNWNLKAWLAGFFAAVIHITSIIPMFFGMELGLKRLSFSATAGLAATFLVYELYLACKYGRLTCCDPSYREKVDLTIDLSSSAKMTKRMRLLGALDNIGDSGGDITIELDTLVTQNNEEKKENVDDNNENQENNQNTSNTAQDVDNFFAPVNLKVKNDLFENISQQNVRLENELAELGILMQFYGTKRQQSVCDCKKFCAFWTVTVIGSLISLGFSLWVWFSPKIFTSRCRT